MIKISYFSNSSEPFYKLALDSFARVEADIADFSLINMIHTNKRIDHIINDDIIVFIITKEDAALDLLMEASISRSIIQQNKNQNLIIFCDEKCSENIHREFFLQSKRQRQILNNVLQTFPTSNLLVGKSPEEALSLALIVYAKMKINNQFSDSIKNIQKSINI